MRAAREGAETTGGFDHVLGGRVRVIEIGEDIDANPCSGTHVTNLSEIGEFTIEGVSPLDEPGGYTLRARIAESLGAT